jgi:hypothetical protein
MAAQAVQSQQRLTDTDVFNAASIVWAAANVDLGGPVSLDEWTRVERARECAGGLITDLGMDEAEICALLREEWRRSPAELSLWTGAELSGGAPQSSHCSFGRIRAGSCGTASASRSPDPPTG